MQRLDINIETKRKAIRIGRKQRLASSATDIENSMGKGKRRRRNMSRMARVQRRLELFQVLLLSECGNQSLRSEPARGPGARAALFLVERLCPLIRLPIRFVLCYPVAVLQHAHQLVFLSRHNLPVAVGEFTPLLTSFTCELFPVTFYSVPIHVSYLLLLCSKPEAPAHASACV